MAIYIFAASCLLTYVVIRKVKTLEKDNANKRFAYHFFKSSLDFLIPLNFVLLFYFCLAIFTFFAAEFAGIQFLVQLEAFFAKIKSILSMIKLDAISIVLIMSVIFIIGILFLPSHATRNAFNILNKYQSLTRKLYMVFVLLCSFTLLGSDLGKPYTDLKVRISTIRKGYADLRDDLHETLSENVAMRIYSKSLNDLPPAYQGAIALTPRIKSEKESLRNYYRSAQSQFGIRDRGIEIIISSKTGHTKSYGPKHVPNNAKSEDIIHGEQIPSVTQNVSYHNINSARKSLANYRISLLSRINKLLKIEGADQIVAQFPKVVTDETKKAVFKQLMAEYPFIEPVIEVFSRSIDRKIETEVNQAVTRLTESSIRSPGTIDNNIDEEASRVVDKAKCVVSSTDLKKANLITRQMETTLSNIKNARLKIDFKKKQVENDRIDKLIAQLKSSKENVRLSASSKLSSMGENLSEGQIGKIISIMRHGNESWRKFLYREGHCDWFEYTKARYYAGECLTNMNSSHVSEKIKEEARVAMENGKTKDRVTDPGWV